MSDHTARGKKTLDGKDVNYNSKTALISETLTKYAHKKTETREISVCEPRREFTS